MVSFSILIIIFLSADELLDNRESMTMFALVVIYLFCLCNLFNIYYADYTL